MSKTPPPAPVEVDALMGGDEIAAFLSAELGRPIKRRAAYRMIANGTLPGGKLGEALIMSSRSGIRARLKEIASGERSS